MNIRPLYQLPTERAPKEWKTHPLIKETKPKSGVQISLQRIINTNICVWMISDGIYWKPYGDYFMVTEK